VSCVYVCVCVACVCVCLCVCVYVCVWDREREWKRERRENERKRERRDRERERKRECIARVRKRGLTVKMVYLKKKWYIEAGPWRSMIVTHPYMTWLIHIDRGSSANVKHSFVLKISKYTRIWIVTTHFRFCGRVGAVAIIGLRFWFRSGKGSTYLA